MTDIYYPIKYCHFCNQIILYTRYDKGLHYAYCNNPANTGCMSITYLKQDDKIDIQEFSFGDETFYFRVCGERNHLLIKDYTEYQTIRKNLFDVDINTILNKNDSIKLSHSIRKTILLLD